MKAPDYTDEQIAYVIDTYPTHTVQQQADHLGRTYSAIRGLRSKLIRAGRINATPLRPWTPADDEQLIELICDGVGMHRIARKLDRTHRAVKTRLEHHGGIAAIRSLLHSPLPILDVARLFGVHHHRVQRWVHWGWLTTKRGRRKHEPRLILQESIAAFIANPRYWMAWEPKHMTDPDWRAEAERLRAEADGFWVPLNDWTVARGYHNAYASKWVRSGLIPAVHELDRYWVWSTDLEQFTPPTAPCRQPGALRSRRAA